MLLTNSRETVALARWQYPHTLSTTQQAEKEKSQNATPAKPIGYNTELEKEVLGAIDNFREKHVDNSKDFGAS